MNFGNPIESLRWHENLQLIAAIVLASNSRGCRKGKKWATSGAGASASPIAAVTEDYH